MARVNRVKRYQGKRGCQHELADGRRCGLTKGAAAHMTDAPDGPDYLHPFDPGPAKTCGKCGRAIEIGDPYKFVKTRSSPYSSTRRERCDTCPDWKASELTSSGYLSTKYAADEDAPIVEVSDDPEAVEESLRALAEHYGQAAASCAEMRTEAADNIEDGFGHETMQSADLREEGDGAQGVADELENWEPSSPFEDPGEDEDLDGDELAEARESALQDWAAEQQQEIEDHWGEMP